MSKKTLIASVTFVLLAGSAYAADLPRRAAPPVYAAPVPLFTWTGFYVGVNAGYSFSNNGNAATIGTPGFVGLGPTLVPGSLNTKSNGFTGGGQVGYNYQVSSLVYGIEADLDYIGQNKTGGFTSPALVLGSRLTTSASHKLDYLATLRGRLGFTPSERLLLYVTGGLAFGNVKTNGSVIANAAPTLVWSGSNSSTRFGFALGGGAEYAFTDNISLRAEYLYYNLGKQTTSALGNANVRANGALNGIDYISSTKTEGSIVRAALNYKF